MGENGLGLGVGAAVDSDSFLLQEKAVRPCLIWNIFLNAQLILSQGAGWSKKSKKSEN